MCGCAAGVERLNNELNVPDLYIESVVEIVDVS
jgi:hypothetical protein